MTTRADILSLAERFFAAIEDGDLSTVRDLYAPEASIWHNNDRTNQSREENLATLNAFIGASRSRRYEITMREVFAGGFVQEHVLTAESHAGETFELPACIVCLAEHGRITRLAEYFDSAQVNELVAGMTRGLS